MKLLVEGQKISSFDSPPIRLVAGSTEFVPVELQCSSDWDGLLMTVQFIQKGKTINKYIGEARTLNVPADISAGWLMISCFGAKADTAVFGTVNGYEIEVYPAGLSSTEQEPIPPTPNLYNQLISEIKRYAEETEASADKVKEAQETSAQAKTIADQIQKNAEDGVYNGRDGEQGPQGIQGPIGPQGPQGLKGEPGTTDFNELQSIPFTPILSDTLEVTTLKEGAYAVNVESVNVLVNGKSPNEGEEPLILPKGTFIFKSADGQMSLIGNFGGVYISDYEVLDSWKGANFAIDSDLEHKQDKLVSGQTIKTINNESILGSGNFELPKSPIDWHIDEINMKEPGWYYYTKDTKDDTNIILINDDGSKALFPGFNNVKYAVGCKIYNYELDEHGSLTNNPIGATVIYFTSNPDDNDFYQPGNNIGMMKFNKINGSWEANDSLNLSLGSLFYNDKMIIMLLQEAASTQEAGRLVTTKGPDETGMNTFNTSGIGKGLKLENQELSVNTEGLDISKATVEDATQEIPATPLMSGILFPLMQQITGYEERLSKLNWQSTIEYLKEDTEHYTIANARDNQEIYIWLNRKDGINTGAQGVLTLDLFGNEITLGNLGTDITNIFLHIVRCGYGFAIIDFFDATADTTYSFNINKSMGTFPVLMKDQASVTLRTSAGNFTAGTGVYIFNKLWMTNQ